MTEELTWSAFAGTPGAPDETAPATRPAQRLRAGANCDTSPETLIAPASDPDVAVGVVVAMNEAAPPQADQLLAADADEGVRAVLARKIAALAPSLAEETRTRLNEQVKDTLSVLVRDDAVRVRAAISEVVKDMPDAPRELILLMARGREFARERAGPPAVAAAHRRGFDGAAVSATHARYGKADRLPRRAP
jgi:hypothetical protein